MDELHETRLQKLGVRTGKHVTDDEASLMLEYHRRQYSIERIAEDQSTGQGAYELAWAS